MVNLYKEQFNIMNTDEIKNFLVHNGYQNFRIALIGGEYKIRQISLTNDRKFIFACIF